MARWQSFFHGLLDSWTAEARGPVGQLTPQLLEWGSRNDVWPPLFPVTDQAFCCITDGAVLRTAKNPVICIVCVVENCKKTWIMLAGWPGWDFRTFIYLLVGFVYYTVSCISSKRLANFWASATRAVTSYGAGGPRPTQFLSRPPSCH